MDAGRAESIYRIIGARIASLRKAREFSQEKLAHLIGLSRVSIVNIEQGRHRIQLHTLMDITDQLDADIRDLVFISEITPDKEDLPRDFTKQLGEQSKEVRDSVHRLLSKKGEGIKWPSQE